MWEDFIINTAISTILMLVQKGSASNKKKWKAAMVKIARAIMLAYPSEFPDA